MALNRKNALFAGSDGGAEHWAVIASLIETCKLTKVDPYAYLAETITRIVDGHPQQPPRRTPGGPTPLPSHSRMWPENSAYVNSFRLKGIDA